MHNFFKDRRIKSQSALPDTRPAKERSKDYIAEEITTQAVVPFQNKQITELTATIYNQWYVGSCVPHGFYTQLEYEGIAPKGMSQLRAYRKRTNYPQAGCIATDMYDQIRKGQSDDFATPLYFTEEDANDMPRVEGIELIPDFKYFQYISSTGGIQTDKAIADVAQGKAVAIYIYATTSEWSREYVTVRTPDLNISNASVRHCVCLVPKGDFTDRNGNRWLAVHDSAKFNNRHLRYISEDFLYKRVYMAAKVYKEDDIPTPPPVDVGLPFIPCQKGDKGDKVLALQKFLIKKGTLKPEYATGYYGSLTSKAVLWWQLKNHQKFTSNIPQLLEWRGDYWGKQSIDLIKR